MFEASAAKFARAVGRDVYLPAPSLASSKSCQLAQVVVKKKSKWFFVRDQYTPTELSLRDVLADGDDFELPSDAPADLVTYNKTSVLKISGQFAASFKETFEAELDGVDSIQLDANFGLVQREEICMAKLISAVANRTVNMQHELLKELLLKKRRSLCMIVGVARTAQVSHLHAKLNFDLKANAKVWSSVVSNNDEVSSDCERTLDVPAGTILAYQIAELKIGKLGEIRVILTKDAEGGFSADVNDHVDNKTEEVQDPLQREAASALQGLSTMSRDGRLALGAALRRTLPDHDALLRLDRTLKRALATGCVAVAAAADEEAKQVQGGGGGDRVPSVLSLLADACSAAEAKELHSGNGATAEPLLRSVRSITRSALELSDEAREALLCDLGGDSSRGARVLAALASAAADRHATRAATDIEDLLVLLLPPPPANAEAAPAKAGCSQAMAVLGELLAAYIVVAGLCVHLL